MVLNSGEDFWIIFYIIPLIISLIILIIYKLRKVDCFINDNSDWIWMWSFLPFFNLLLLSILLIIAPTDLKGNK